jgi:hypothetical protein
MGAGARARDLSKATTATPRTPTAKASMVAQPTARLNFASSRAPAAHTMKPAQDTGRPAPINHQRSARRDDPHRRIAASSLLPQGLEAARGWGAPRTVTYPGTYGDPRYVRVREMLSTPTWLPLRLGLTCSFAAPGPGCAAGPRPPGPARSRLSPRRAGPGTGDRASERAQPSSMRPAR